MIIDSPEITTVNDSTQDFWQNLKSITSDSVHSASNVEPTILKYLEFVCPFIHSTLENDQDLTRCCYSLIHSPVVSRNKAFARRKLISTLIQSKGQYSSLTLLGAILLLDGRHSVATLEMMEEEDQVMPLLVQTIRFAQSHSFRLHRIFLELLYEMCRVQKLTRSDLDLIDTVFINYLFSTIESRFGYDYDPYSFAVIKVLLALNEQFMVAAYDKTKNLSSNPNTEHDAQTANPPQSINSCSVETRDIKFEDEDTNSDLRKATSMINMKDLEQDSKHSQQDFNPITLENRVFSSLVQHKTEYRTFGENIVFLLNRSPDGTLQLMVLKLLYLIFTTPTTFEYLYLNDLKVIVDVFIRELYNLSNDDENLIHTYLRVLHPLLLNTELKDELYKRQELVLLLEGMSDNASRSCVTIGKTTQRLAYRCLFVDWLAAPLPKLRKTKTFDDSLTTIHSNASVPTFFMAPRANTDEGLSNHKNTNYNPYRISILSDKIKLPVTNHTRDSSDPPFSNSKPSQYESGIASKSLEQDSTDSEQQPLQKHSAPVHNDSEFASNISHSTRSSRSYDKGQETEDTVLTPMSPLSTVSSNSDFDTRTKTPELLEPYDSDSQVRISGVDTSCASNVHSPFSNNSSVNSTTVSLHEAVSSPTFSNGGAEPVLGQKAIPPPPPPSRTRQLQKSDASPTHRNKPPPPPPSASRLKHSKSSDALSMLGTLSRSICPPPPPPPSIHRFMHTESSELINNPIKSGESPPQVSLNLYPPPVVSRLAKGQRRGSSPADYIPKQPVSTPTGTSFSAVSSRTNSPRHTPSPIPPTAPPSRGSSITPVSRLTASRLAQPLPPPPPPPSRPSNRLQPPNLSTIGMSIRNTSALELATSYVSKPTKENKKPVGVPIDSGIEDVGVEENIELDNEEGGLSDITDDSWLSDGDEEDTAEVEENKINQHETNKEQMSARDFPSQERIQSDNSISNVSLFPDDIHCLEKVESETSKQVPNINFSFPAVPKSRPSLAPPIPPLPRLRSFASAQNLLSQAAINKKHSPNQNADSHTQEESVNPAANTLLQQMKDCESNAAKDSGFDFGLDKLPLPPSLGPSYRPRTSSLPESHTVYCTEGSSSLPSSPRHGSFPSPVSGEFPEAKPYYKQPASRPAPPSNHTHPHHDLNHVHTQHHTPNVRHHQYNGKYGYYGYPNSNTNISQPQAQQHRPSSNDTHSIKTKGDNPPPIPHNHNHPHHTQYVS